MFDLIIPRLSLSMEDLLQEFDGRQLAFIYLCSKRKFSTIKELKNMEETMDLFDIEMEGLVGKTKEEIMELILEKHPSVKPQDILLSIYQGKTDTNNELANSITSLTDMVFFLDEKFLGKMEGDFFLHKFFKDFCFKDKEWLNIMGLLSLIGKIDDISMEERLNFHTKTILREEITERILYYYATVSSKKIKTIQADVGSLTKMRDGTLEQSLKKDNQIMKLKEDLRAAILKNEELTKQVEAAKNQPGNPELVNQLYESIKKKDAQIQELVKDIKNIKEKPNKTYDTLIANLNNQILEMRKNNDAKKEEIRKLKQELQKHDSAGIKGVVKEYLLNTQLDEEMKDVISQIHKEHLTEKEIMQAAKSQEEVAEPRPHSRIGYCVIKDGKHYIVSPGEQEEEILNLPENKYLGWGQFVCVDSQNNFKWYSQYKVEYPNDERNVTSYGFVCFQGDEIFADKGSYDYVKIKNIPPNVHLREKQIVALDSNNNFIRFYKSLRVNADAFMESVKAKGQKMGFVIKALPSGCFIRDVEDGTESFISFKPYIEEISEFQTVFYRGDEIITVINNPRYYTTSTLYKNVNYGAVEIKGDNVFVQKLSGELVIIKDIPPTLNIQTGDVIGFDEFNNYVDLKESTCLTSEKKEIKRKPSEKITYIEDKRTSKIRDLQNAKTIAIIGNKKYAASYNQSLSEKGYIMKFVDGYDSWINIKHETKGADIIVVITEFISHKNMGKVKEEITGAKIIYSQYEGANRVVDAVLKAEGEMIS